MQFSLTDTTPIGAIGAFDNGGDGFINGSVQVGIWNSAKTLIYSTNRVEHVSANQQFGNFFWFPAQMAIVT